MSIGAALPSVPTANSQLFVIASGEPYFREANMGERVSRRGFLGSTLGGAIGMSLAGHGRASAAIGASGIGHASIEPIRLPDPTNVWDLPTPALVIDLDAMESNLNKMQDFLTGKTAKLRPHTKTHKSPIIAKKQIEHDAIGICTAKVSEAAVMLEGGVNNILITSPVVTPEKIERVIQLARKSPGVEIVVDRESNVADFNDAAGAARTKLSVLIELDTGTNRTGIEMGKPAMDLLQMIAKSPNLTFGGVQAYAGQVQHLKGYKYRKMRSKQTLARALGMKHEMEKAGFDVPVLSVGGTGTYNIDTDIEGVTDLQAGSYLFMDVDYRGIGGKTSAIYDDFQPSLFVIATAISQPIKGRITIDAGLKAFASDKTPALRDITGVTYRFAGDEHGILELKNPSKEIKVGDKVALLASHCDPTVNLYDQYYAYRGEQVEEIWPVAGRGRSQ